MDFLNKSFTQLRDLFQSMTPGARITSGLLLAVVVISLVYLFTHGVAGPEVYLLGGEEFSNRELANMQAALGQEGLESEIVGTKIRISLGQENACMAALAKRNALPQDLDEILKRALDEGGLYDSRDQRQERIKNAKQAWLSRAISDMPGIERAAVIYDAETRRGLRDDKISTASVIVQPAGNQPLDPAWAASIRLFVKAAYAGLQAKDIAVTDWNTKQTTLGDPEGYAGPYTNSHFALEQARAEELKKQIQGLLTWIPNKTVAVHVELDPVRNYQEEEVSYDPKASAPGYTYEKTNSRTVEPTTPRGPVGYRAQGNTAASLASSTSAASRQEEEESASGQQNLVSRKTTTTGKADYPVKRVTVAVAVPTSYFESVWRQDNPARPGEEPKTPEPNDLDPIRTEVIAKITGTVAALIPVPEGVTDATELVKVEEFPDIAPPEIPEPGLGEKAVAWLGQYWTTLGLIGLAFFSLVMLRSMVQAASASATEGATAASLPPAAEGEEAEAEQERGRQARKLKRFTGTGASLRDELSELVAEDPETAASILRNWIGSV
jgi:flagellar M-ring protein FliF